MLQYEFRCFHLHLSLNDLDFKVINILTNLSINSFYQIVRDEARNQLFELIGQYQYSSLTILPNIIRFLNKTDKKITIEQLEGCLLLLKGNNLQNSMLIKQNWFILGKLWPSLFKCKYFEHDMIQKLLDKIYFSANLSFNSFNNQIKLSDRTISLAYELSALEIYASDELRLKLFNQKCSFENSIISKLIEDLINIASDNSLSSKSQEISLFSLIFLLDSCKKNPKLLTPELTELFTKSLINENRNFRRISIDALCVLLKMTKYKKIITEYKVEELLKEPLVNCYTPGYRMDNECHLYDYNFNDWENAKYLDKSYWGYYSWPAKIQVPSNQRLIHSEEMSGEYSEALKPILKYFKNKNFIQKFIKLNQLESEKFDKKKFYFFKALFRNFGTCDIFVDLYENLTYLISDTKTIESSHKLAAEIISGLIRGSKYYALDELKKLWNKLNELFDLIVEKITSDTLEIWTDCFSNSFEDQDPRRMTFYLNYLKDGLNRVLNELSCLDTRTKPSFKLTNFLQLLTSLSQFEWKIPNFWNDIIQRLTDFMGHTNKLVREIIYSCAVLSTSNEVTYGKNFKDASYKNNLLTKNYKSRTKNLSTFIDIVETKLNKCVELYEHIHDESLSAEYRKELQRSKIDELISNSNFVQTILNWFILYLTKCLEPFSLETLRLFPLLSKLDKITSDETSKSKLVALRMYLPIWSMDQNCIQPLIEIIKQVSESKYWRSKQASLQMMRNFPLYNIFIFNETDKIELKEILLNLICDENLNVRLSACVTLTYLLHSNFFSIDNNLIEHFKSLSQIELNKIKDENEKTVLNQLSVAKRHGGVLGLCSIVNASPHEIPIYLPQIITYLADFTDDPEPIKDSVKKCLNDFKRTHFDNWNEHKQAFSDEQLSVLSDITIASSYYA
ncbi:unnamed protein product [Brachionus calyciflorus]|uniref:Proteasome activator complex subunit 4 n=1 Tax=Brachionus calyciflorus TaxID=104777 RepID=A0A814GIV3_9BILA|nr:unnamed protein product [Brachionus calyciflorus]